MSQTSDPVRNFLTQYAQAVHEKNVVAFVSLYADDLHVFDMWNNWELRGIEAWRRMAEGWFGSLGDERVVVAAKDIEAVTGSELALGHATLTFTAVTVEGKELRSLDNRLTLAMWCTDADWKVFHEHTSAPIMHESMKGMIKRPDGIAAR
jgi:ketosteroid isomerase-like protein